MYDQRNAFTGNIYVYIVTLEFGSGQLSLTTGIYVEHLLIVPEHHAIMTFYIYLHVRKCMYVCIG